MSETHDSTIEKPKLRRVHIDIEPEQRQWLMEYTGEKTLRAAVDKLMREALAEHEAKKKSD
jgi:hypothetical protein